ncbi:hypothetical protein Achl_2938 [Pseudarthrobacter chlorophenolicus A6]|uniref:Uncharacterized protein n=1 Tax=Pseudarthrobacter chlorophenolicus (strain ATCC 700700 / DSM 12829 / CIP 107037 / JCM 12360 / KCTC 9906 / NCIMB 13794 / A6) TaxID=452863 RepID=B8HEF5_PSECP|nr:hypothetical protein Achl_2938 [Pseudarthrobacter chlorophenolicus A6]SDQ73213.1 hypothetical protein SAMN04489738_2542 [Pseudarthrobacter chlorophenolicus]
MTFSKRTDKDTEEDKAAIAGTLLAITPGPISRVSCRGATRRRLSFQGQS